MTSRVPTLALGLLFVASSLVAQTPLGSAFTYQGRLTDGASPANRAYDFENPLFTSAASGTQVGQTAVRNDVLVASGLFTVSLDFGPAAFAGSARWIEVAVRPGASGGAYTTLAPRQELTPAPNAVYSTAAPWAGLVGLPPGFADGVDNDSGGTVTSVTGGTGLTGGTITSAGTLGVAFGGNGAATSVARSDHDHDQAYAGTAHTHLGQSWSGAAANGLRLTVAGGNVFGLWAETSGPDSIGAVGYSSAPTGSGFGLYGQSDSSIGSGTFGWITSTAGIGAGVAGRHDGPSGAGVYGYGTATTGNSIGVVGETSSSAGIGIQGRFLQSAGTGSGVQGRTSSTTSGSGVNGVALATSGSALGVWGTSAGNAGFGVYGNATSTTGFTYGVYGRASSPNGVAVQGDALATSGSAIGVYGSTNSTSGGRGLVGFANATTGTSIGVQGLADSTAGLAGQFAGRVQVTGTLTKGGGAFQIDHPLDPENKYLYHSFVESPDMKNIDDGVVTTDDAGFATVTLPDWFEALNRDFRYQLTVIGDGAWARARVFRRIAGGRFVIQTDLPGIDVSWQVTGIRHDRFAEKNRIPLEEDKPEAERGRYLHPDAWGQPPEAGVVVVPRTRDLSRVVPDEADIRP
jgi:hypothetical protein